MLLRGNRCLTEMKRELFSIKASQSANENDEDNFKLDLFFQLAEEEWYKTNEFYIHEQAVDNEKEHDPYEGYSLREQTTTRIALGHNIDDEEDDEDFSFNGDDIDDENEDYEYVDGEIEEIVDSDIGNEDSINGILQPYILESDWLLQDITLWEQIRETIGDDIYFEDDEDSEFDIDDYEYLEGEDEDMDEFVDSDMDNEDSVNGGLPPNIFETNWLFQEFEVNDDDENDESDEGLRLVGFELYWLLNDKAISIVFVVNISLLLIIQPRKEKEKHSTSSFLFTNSPHAPCCSVSLQWVHVTPHQREHGT